MTILAKPGVEHTYKYEEYPACRYHASGDIRRITCAEQEEAGWYDSPTKANEEAIRLRDELSAKNAEAKEKARAEKSKEKQIEQTDAPAKEEQNSVFPTKQAVTRMKMADLIQVAATLGLEIPADSKRPALIKLINAKLE